jgi:hypothetical protein
MKENNRKDSLMTRIITTLVVVVTLLISQVAVAASGKLFQVSSTGPSAGTNGSAVMITLCLNGNGPLSCQNFTVSTLNLSINTTIPNRTYPMVGIKINTPGYTPTGCTQISNGYCLFAASNAAAANITLSAQNIVPMFVDAGPPGVNALNSAYVSITVCQPGTTNCQVIDNVQVDTGSTGVRLIASVLNPTLNLPAVLTNGLAVAECHLFSFSTWGSVRTADVTIGGKTAHSIPIQIMGDPAAPYAPTIPTGCPTPRYDTVESFGANGIIGISNFIQDCGTDCISNHRPASGNYYTCNSVECVTPTNLPLAQQVTNPVTLFETDNNGVILQLPSIPDTGATQVVGALIFGIGTQANNSLGSATVYPLNSTGYFKTIYNNVAYKSYTDSGTSSFVFHDSTIPICDGGYYCPTQPLNLQATSEGYNGTPSGVINFTLVSYASLANGITAALIGYPPSGDYIAWGLSFFFGRTAYTAIDGASTPGGTGPYVAF